MIALTFALPDESRAFLPLLADRAITRRGPLRRITGRCKGREVTIIHTGVGSGAECRKRLDEELGISPRPSLLISAGYAGGLQANLAAGHLLLAENFSDPTLLALARDSLAAWDGLHTGLLTTQPGAAESVADKAALAAATGALAVDMESAWIAEACHRESIPMLSLRVISDAADQPLPVPGAVMFDEKRQTPRYLTLPAWLLAHPGRIAPFARFVRNLAPARSRLAQALEAVISHLKKTHF